MPSGEGTYGSQVGRPTKKSVRQEASKQLKTADPRFSPKRGKSKAVAKTISSKKQQRRFSKTIGALNRKGNPFPDHRFRTDRGKEAKEDKKKGLKPVPPLRRRTPRAIAKGTAPRAIGKRRK
tara:strand:+ start:975 stop:1340 length:366 start_codon:yes stop_codon:yes gene_type:complete